MTRRTILLKRMFLMLHVIESRNKHGKAQVFNISELNTVIQTV